jgi:UDP-N-acetylmuramoyl-tripeptide--D-alanyl-D-alanine ligase
MRIMHEGNVLQLQRSDAVAGLEGVVRMTAAEIARILGAEVEGNAAVTLIGAEVDSRRLERGDLFVALSGARRDGHEFVEASLEIAAAALVRRDARLNPPPTDRALVRVDDPLAAYHELARHEIRQHPWRIAAVTGSVGKTTTKDFMAALLAPHFRIGASGENRNNTLGLPAEILSQDPEIEVFVAEAGMSTPGELTTLGEILHPEVLLYTRIAPVHTEFFPDLQGVVRAKAELLPWLRNEGVLVINDDDPNQRDFPSETKARVVGYGTPSSEARIEDLEDRGLVGCGFRLVLPTGQTHVDLALPGRHQAENLLAAATAASAFGVRAEQVAEVAHDLEAPAHRGRIMALEDGISLVDDSYNSSPLAVQRLLDLLARVPGRKVAVLGEMYELGDVSSEAHRRAGEQAAAACDLLVAVGGSDAERIASGAREAGLPDRSIRLTENADQAAATLKLLLRAGDVVLIKGSRGVGLDRTVAALAGEEAD